MTDLSAVLLCGGESRRMGRDKSVVIWHERPLWEWQVEKLRELKSATIFISARNRPSWLPADVQFVRDLPPSRGPLSGLAATLSECGSAHLLVLAIDLPAMKVMHLKSLCGLVRPGVGVVPVIAGRAEPLAAIYPSEARADFVQALTVGDASLQPLVRQLVESGKLRIVEITATDRDFYYNVNEPHDLDRMTLPGGSGEPALPSRQ